MKIYRMKFHQCIKYSFGISALVWFFFIRYFFSGCSAARLAHLVWDQRVAGSNPATPTKEKARHESAGFCFFNALTACWHKHWKNKTRTSEANRAFSFKSPPTRISEANLPPRQSHVPFITLSEVFFVSCIFITIQKI
jgi:hypothetical protein